MIKIGRLYSSIIYQNVGILIALGLLRVLFGEYGWWPNQHLFSIYNAMILYLVPTLLAYTGGRIFGNQRGGIAAAMAVFALALSSHVPMIIGAMILGPLIGLFLGFIEKRVEKKIPIGFELLFVNLLVAVITLLTMVISFEFLGGILSSAINYILIAMKHLVDNGWLPLTAIIIEPLKVFFLNNVINHGILVPIGIQQAKETGESIFFLIQDNPGPGLGVLLAYVFMSSGVHRRNAKVSSIIQFFGGIHEVYFPYVLQNPLLLISVIAGGIVGNYMFETFNSGLVSVSSPGSFLLIMLLSPQGSHFGTFIGIALSAVVSFGTAVIILHTKKMSFSDTIESTDILNSIGNFSGFKFEVAIRSEGKQKDSLLKQESSIQKIVFACEAGMGSSALGATLLRKHMKDHGLNIQVTQSSISNIPTDADLIITHSRFKSLIRREHPEKIFFEIDSFVNESEYQTVIQFIKSKRNGKTLIGPEQVIIKSNIGNEFDAIHVIGEKMAKLGFAETSYTDEMIEREKHFTTYIGKGIAIPHGLTENSRSVLKPGIVIALFPEGVPFAENMVYIAFGIAGFGEKQVNILSIIANLLDEDFAINELKETKNNHRVIAILRKYGL